MLEHAQMYVKKNSMLYHILVLVVMNSLISCATPIGPTGGPRDTEGPQLIETVPPSGTTNYTNRTFEFQFSEFVNRSTVRTNISIEPDLGLEYSLKWKKKKLIIEFDEKLPDSTTIIITLGADLADTRNNKIGSPITLAVSTGDDIDEGQVLGKIRDATTGANASGKKVLLYRSPIDLSKKATYQAQTDTSGTFRFSYLREGKYQVIFVDDRNRNKIWDTKSETAQPFSKQFINLKKAGKDSLDVIYITQKDTLAPKLQGVGMFSSNRIRLRFNENIKVQSNTELNFLDSLGNNFTRGYPLYVDLKDPFVLFVQSEQPLNETSLYSIKSDGISDIAGNEAVLEEIVFNGSSQEDTTLQRIVEHKTEQGVYPKQSIKVVYAEPINNPAVLDSIVVVEGDVSFNDWPNLRIEDNILFIEPQDSWIEGLDYQFLVWNPATQRRKLLEPEIWDNSELGEIEINISNVDSTEQFKFSLVNEDISFSIDSTLTNTISISNLAPVSYKLTVFKDENMNGIWDSGSIIPYLAPEPFYIQKEVKIQNSFTSEIRIEF